jgi:putative addiction module killer protein
MLTATSTAPICYLPAARWGRVRPSGNLTACIRPDTLSVVTTFFRTPEFDAWLRALRDPIGKARIIARVRSAEAGNLGDCAPVGAGISEMRVHAGPGYRVYFCRREEVVYLLLCGGDKSSQKRDIAVAKIILARLEKIK